MDRIEVEKKFNYLNKQLKKLRVRLAKLETRVNGRERNRKSNYQKPNRKSGPAVSYKVAGRARKQSRRYSRPDWLDNR
jgi:hypothetical protein